MTSKPDYGQLRREHVRCSMLRTLSDMPGGRCNESMLRDSLEMLGIGCSRDEVRTQIQWLDEQGLVTVDNVAGVFVPEITARGIDVSYGLATVTGVKKPTNRD